MAKKKTTKPKTPPRRSPRRSAGRVRSADLLRRIAVGVSAAGGGNVLDSLIQYLTKTLSMDYAFVGEVVRDKGTDVINVLSATFAGRIADNPSCPILNTPCREVVKRNLCVYPQGVRKLFPKSRELADLEAECYAGVPLFGSAGQLLGVLAVMDRKPLRHRTMVELLLQIFAVRAAAELERRRVSQALEESHRTLSTLMGNLPGMVYRCRNDKDWTLEFASEGCLDLTGYPREDLTGNRQIAYAQLIRAEDQETVWSGVQEALRENRPFQLTYRITTAKGEEKWVWEQGRGIYSPSGELLALEGFITDITARKRAELALVQSEERFRKVYEASATAICISRVKDGQILDVNPAWVRTTGWGRDEAAGRTTSDLQLWLNPGEREALLQRVHQQGSLQDVDWQFRTKSGAIRHARGSMESIFIEGEECLLVAGQDVTERKTSETEMQKLSHALEQIADAVMITDRNGIIEYVNPAFEATTGYSRDETIGRKPSLIKSGKQGPDFYKKLWKTILSGEVFSEVFINRRKDGSLYYEEKTITPLRDEQGNITHFVATGKDISERMQAQERLQFMAQHDVLTELPNRALFLDRLKQALARARMHRRLVAVLFLDLDRFKNINDTLGHQIGDHLLQEIARRFGNAVRDGDTVARLSGDEFGFLLEDSTSEKDISYIAEKILDSLKPVFVVDGHDLFVSASIGISLYPNDGEESVTLLRNADVAMYRAKDMGKNNCQFYSADMSLMAFERLSLESSLRRAVDREEFLLYYQPQVDVQTGKILGVEALLRWQHPDLGLVLPNDFIALLEENGLIIPVGEWVLRKACAQVRDWQKAGWEQLSLAVNLSARQFNASGLVEMVERTTSELGFERERLELEITESVIMRNAQATLDALEALSRMGIQLAVDDFGTGYSSLSYLRRFPIDTLKIDSSFIRDIPQDPDDSAITTAIIVMAQSLKLKVIAEGVETQEQLDYLRASGCHAIQGYFFSKPLPAEELTVLLSKCETGSGWSGAQGVVDIKGEGQ